MIVIALDDGGQPERQAILEICRSTPAEVWSVPDIYPFLREVEERPLNEAS